MTSRKLRPQPGIKCLRRSGNTLTFFGTLLLCQIVDSWSITLD